MMHTKGPWKVSEKRAKRFTIIRVVTDTLPAPHKIATMPRSDNVNRANARLIAAAPDMLHALETIMLDTESLQIREVAGYAIRKAKEEN